MPAVSVIIPTYNRKEQTLQALESVCGQSYKDFELIVVDDGSTDGTVDYLRSAHSAQSVQYIALDKNRGVSYARNRGIEAARGEWICFLDSDDTWHEKKIQKQIDWILDNPNYRILQTEENWVRNGKPIVVPKVYRKVLGENYNLSLERCMISPSSVMIRCDLLEEKGLFDETFPACEDYDLWLRITATEPVGLVSEPLMTRFGGADDQLSTTVPVLDQYRIKALDKMLDSGALNPEQKQKTVDKLSQKCQIVSAGYRKHGQAEKAIQYDVLNQKWKTLCR